MNEVKKVVLAYSGGLDTSVILKWLQDTYGCEVVTFTADIGQGEELAPARSKAKLFGVKQIFIEDLREEFVRDFVFPMFRANALYEGEYLLGTSIARPLIAKRLVEIARKTGADADLARRHRQGQRPGALRARRLRADAGRARHRAVARMGPHLAREAARLRRGARHPGRGQEEEGRRRPTPWTRTCCTSPTRAASWRIRTTSPRNPCGASRSRPRRRPTGRSTSSSPTGAATSSR